MKLFPVGLVLASAISVLGHSTFQELWVNGVDQAGSCVRQPPSNSPVTSVNTTDLRCNVDGATGVSGVCAVPPGANVTVEMHAQPGDRSCAEQALGGAHHGPLIVYMSKVNDATTADGSSTWFKVSEIGYNQTSGLWADDYLNANCGHYSFKIPADLQAGNYLLRAEVIALHVASSIGGAQFYMSCYQIAISGSGTVVPGDQVLIPGLYKATDPGILINIYYPTVTNYTIPGPTEVFTG